MMTEIRWWLCVLAICPLACGHWFELTQVLGQDTPESPAKKSIEVFRGTVKTDSSGRRVVTEVELQRAVNRTRRLRRQVSEIQEQLSRETADLAAQSFDSFRRGLMPLPDHLEQLALAQRAGVLTAGSAEQRIELQLQHVDRLDAVVGALQAFNQPNAEGWQADLLLAQALAADARAKLAELQEREDAAEAVRQTALALAEAHLKRRQADSTIGWATVPMLVNARLVVQQIRQDEPYTALPAGKFLEDAIVLTRSWQERNAGIGRSDRVALAEYQQARYALRHGLKAEKSQIARLYRMAEAAALKLYDQKRAFLRTGTASLYDVAQAWSFRSDLTDILAGVDLAPPADSEQRLLRDLDALQQFAASVSDRRGRIAADLSYVSVLGRRQNAIRAIRDLADAESAVEELRKLSAEPSETTPSDDARSADRTGNRPDAAAGRRR